DFSGRWQGKLFGYESPEGDEETFLITQDGLRVSVWPPRSTTPLVSGLARDRVFVSRTIPENDGRLDEDQWTLTLKGTETLHVHYVFLTPGGFVSEATLEGDLHRIS